jgi:hypothetical protein
MLVWEKLSRSVKVGVLLSSFTCGVVQGMENQEQDPQSVSSFVTISNMDIFSNDQWVYTNIVEQGFQQATDLGYPTANLPLGETKLPQTGTWLCEVLYANQRYNGMCYTDGQRPVLEVHLFDYQGDLYGQFLQVSLITHVMPHQNLSPHDLSSDDNMVTALKAILKEAYNRCQKELSKTF